MKVKKKIVLGIVTSALAAATLVPMASALSLDECFISWINYRTNNKVSYKQSCSSTEKSQNGIGTYQGEHYLHNWVGTHDESIAYVDTGRVYNSVGFTLRTDYTKSSHGSAEARYGN